MQMIPKIISSVEMTLTNFIFIYQDVYLISPLGYLRDISISICPKLKGYPTPKT